MRNEIDMAWISISDIQENKKKIFLVGTRQLEVQMLCKLPCRRWYLISTLWRSIFSVQIMSVIPLSIWHINSSLGCKSWNANKHRSLFTTPKFNVWHVTHLYRWKEVHGWRMNAGTCHHILKQAIPALSLWAMKSQVLRTWHFFGERWQFWVTFFAYKHRFVSKSDYNLLY